MCMVCLSLGKTPIKRSARDFSLPETPVAFSAFLHDGNVDVNTRQIVVFNVTQVNEGDAYHDQTGLFVAPKNGLYFFTLTLNHPQQSSPAHVSLVKNADVVARIHADLRTWEQSSQSVILNLSAGDEVFVRNDDYDHKSFAGLLQSSFSGFLLWAA